MSPHNEDRVAPIHRYGLGDCHPFVRRACPHQKFAFAHKNHLDSILAVFITLFALASAVPSPSAGEPLPPLLYSWARFLGVTSAIFASVQYPPQILRTYQAKVVGALSIPMMCIQSPGGLLMVLSIALRPGTNWTSESPGSFFLLLHHHAN